VLDHEISNLDFLNPEFRNCCLERLNKLLTLIRVVVSFIRFVYSRTPKRSWGFFMMVVLSGFVRLSCGGS